MATKLSYFISKYGLIFGSIFMLIVSSIVLRNGIIDQEITEQNKQVKVQIRDWSKSRKTHFVKLQYKGQNISKRTNGEYYRKFKNENEVLMLTNKEENRFIFPDEFQQNNGYLYGIILVIISLIILYKGVKIAGKKDTQE